MLQSNILPSSSGSRCKPYKRPADLAVFLGLFFGPEDGSDIFLQNINLLSTHFMAVYPRRQNIS
jgi:hypothetical protein